MRQLTDAELENIKAFTEKSIEVTLIEPTETGLKKSILDATGTVRNYLASKSLHDYSAQKQGQENKIQIPSYLISESTAERSLASLYRPPTKKGDPRIWFKGLPKFSRPNDIIAIIAYNEQLFVINITQLDVAKMLEGTFANPLFDLVSDIIQDSNAIASELLSRLREIAAQGFIPALLQADTAVGRTLEHLLGIDMNSSKSPDYKGIELKAARGNRATRKGLFAKTPDWEISKFKSRVEVLDEFGYWESGVFRLYNTIRATGRNAQGLILRTDYAQDYLFENSDKAHIGDFLTWRLEGLRNALLSKHKETFWINADTRIHDGKEFFQYDRVIHTKNPLVNQFGLLIDMGAITLDYPIKRMPNGSVEDRGCNFKIKAKALELLFPPSVSYSLLA